MEASVVKTFNKDVEKSATEYFKGEQPNSVSNQAGKALSTGLVKNQKEYTDYLNSFSIELIGLKLKSLFAPEIPVIQASNAIDEVDKNINIQYERLSELYGLYYPEAVRKSKDVNQLVKVLKASPERESVSKGLGVPLKSIGYEFDNVDLNMIKLFALKLEELIILRSGLEDYVTKKMKELAPKLCDVAGPMLGARLMTIAGSFRKIASMASSTVQVLGAEKALFRHLKTGARPPKHGVIIQHPNVQTAKRADKGRMARRLANEISKAVRSDYFK